ncbi:hypothetical protein EDD18DRAFT_1100333 [Armillaria luteobubalina]|uniref:Uncharacterized protein n=1 Tax=Armillaria luteobubalina TaxID=153913 RepID=A0AA39UYN2_9AGAR|nr:hypothetical protein EDD18DRAFT_1100333 [Armillaria luteobubalina]
MVACQGARELFGRRGTLALLASIVRVNLRVPARDYEREGRGKINMPTANNDDNNLFWTRTNNLKRNDCEVTPDNSGLLLTYWLTHYLKRTRLATVAMTLRSPNQEIKLEARQAYTMCDGWGIYYVQNSHLYFGVR